jgi:hypothetical protein
MAASAYQKTKNMRAARARPPGVKKSAKRRAASSLNVASLRSAWLHVAACAAHSRLCNGAVRCAYRVLPPCASHSYRSRRQAGGARHGGVKSGAQKGAVARACRYLFSGLDGAACSRLGGVIIGGE